TNRLEDFVAEVFECVGLDWRDHVESDPSLLRPSEIMVSRANPEKSARILGWQANYGMKDVVKMMVEEFTSQRF
ncbi:MAG: GDP-mannose 4,6-dehydratase, partial [Deltaproteobacteria bacterium]